MTKIIMPTLYHRATQHGQVCNFYILDSKHFYIKISTRNENCDSRVWWIEALFHQLESKIGLDKQKNFQLIWVCEMKKDQCQYE